MAGPDYFGVGRITDIVYDELLVENLISFFDWNLLNIGGFVNVKRPSTKSKLKASDTSGRVWESSVGDWVWESNTSYISQPLVAKLYVNDVLKTTGFYINYPDGQVVFSTGIPLTSKVELEYSYKKFHFYEADSDWFKEVIFDPVDENVINNVLAKNRIYLPAIIVEAVSDAVLEGYQLGDYSVIETQPLLFHIIADRDEDRNKMIYYLKRLFQKTIWLYDSNKVARANKFPLNSDGSIADNALMYPDLVSQFPFKRLQFSGVRPQSITPQLPLFRAIVRVTTKINLP